MTHFLVKPVSSSGVKNRDNILIYLHNIQDTHFYVSTVRRQTLVNFSLKYQLHSFKNKNNNSKRKTNNKKKKRKNDNKKKLTLFHESILIVTKRKKKKIHVNSNGMPQIFLLLLIGQTQ